ncbi:hypothetical protein GM661_13805 [Iocasia frigidifontis]|uniref:Uncharacterized protein n=1 Tax=Iocasia fonsfrigidae TaxID=2682810 RepID=A0A8A7KAZ4_9FIRM|nr:hypothetical protein [Iocasia fonsfrigidae]QTL98956.1 hypothetical protein GM661_13805 [Iocasia fonsfrigidae]
MKLCSLCSRIRSIRVKQELDYYEDLCAECRKKELLLRQVKGVKKERLKLV